MRHIIGLLGVKGGGKDTFAKHLVEDFGYTRIGFADALYREVAAAFGVTVEFLGNRDTKETPSALLALENCADPVFAPCVAHFVKKGAPWTADELKAPRSPRFIMQYWGTEYRRKGAPGVHQGVDSYWLRKVADVIDASPELPFVITDVRFLNEYRFVQEQQGSLVRIRRPWLELSEAADRLKEGTAAHASETELADVDVDVTVLNEEGKFDALKAAAASLVLERQEAQAC